MAVEDDFGGRVVDVRPEGDREGVYVHRGGAYTVEVRDPDDEPGAHRFDPGDEERREVVARTGKASLASFVASVVGETGRQAPGLAGEETGSGGDSGGTDGGTPGASADAGFVTDVADPALRGLLQALSSIATAAERAAERAENGDDGGADNALETARGRIQVAQDDLEAEDHDDVTAVTARRLEQAERRTSQALDTEKVN